MRRVVILGGGYAGLHAFAAIRSRLGRQMRSGELDVVVVSRDPYHTYHGWTGEILSGRMPAKRSLTPIAPLLQDGRLLVGEIRSVNTNKNAVVVSTEAGEQTLEYDHILVATGSKDPFDRLPGLREHGWRLKDTRDMQRLEAHVEKFFEEPFPHDVVVIGGGFAGVEAASALAERRRLRNSPVRIHLVTGGEVLPSMLPRFRKIASYAVKTLETQEITIHSGKRVAKLLPDAVVFADGTSLLSHLTVVAAGIAFEQIQGSDGMARTENGRLVTDRYLHVHNRDNVWAAGDMAEVAHPFSGVPCPTNALWAMKQGDCVGANIARILQGKKPRKFGFLGLGQAAGLAATGGVTELYGMQFTGWLARVIRLGFFAWYFPSRKEGISIASSLLLGRSLAEPKTNAEPAVAVKPLEDSQAAYRP